MPALRKPHRVAFLVPALTVEGADATNASAAGLLLWVACIELCQRHPALAVYDAESTPLVSQDGQFAPEHARPGASPTDAFYGQTRRDELVWLELALPRPRTVRLHTLARDGAHTTFDAPDPGKRDPVGRAPEPAATLGGQIQLVLERWLAARGLAALSSVGRRFEPIDAGELLAQVRVLAPILSEQARAHVQLEELAWTMINDAGAADRSTAMRRLGDDSGPVEIVREPHADALDGEPGPPTIARTLAGRLTAALKAPALRLLALALREDLGDLILAVDPDQPQALLDRFHATAVHGRDYALLRRIIAIAPCWARPYAELVRDPQVTTRTDDDASIDASMEATSRASGEATTGAAISGGPPSRLETVAGAGIAAVCRPGQLDILEAAAARLEEDGRVDEALRLLERAALLHGSSRAHIALVRMHRAADRPGAWLAQAQRSSALHGCPLDPALPAYPDQIQVDLLVSDALLHVGRLGEAIALRGERLRGRSNSWPRHTRILRNWRRDPRFIARCYAREGALRGDPARAVAGYGRVEPADAVDVATLLDALVAIGREDEVVLAWSQFGLGKQLTAPVARLAAARGLLAAGEWRRGIDELWRVGLTAPGRDDHAAIARAGRMLAGAPLDVLETALGERVAMGARSLAARMARDIADFVPGAGKSSIVLRALGRAAPIEFDPSWLAGFGGRVHSRAAIDAVFAEARTEATINASTKASTKASIERSRDDRDSGADAAQARADRLVNRWLEVVSREAADPLAGDPTDALARAAAYTAAQALGRYLAATTAPPSPLAGGYRTVAAEALAVVWQHRAALADHDVRALLGVLDPLLRRVDRWLGGHWLGAVERACAIDERAGGDLAGFAREHAVVAARIIGPEEIAVLSASVARLVRERPDGWAAAVAAQAGRLAQHTGGAAAAEWADAVAAQHAAREIELDEAVDALLTASYLAEAGGGAGPCVHAARALLAAGRAPAAFAAVCAGLAAGGDSWRQRALTGLAPAWNASIDVPLEPGIAAALMFDALESGEPARAEKLGRFAVALDPDDGEAHRNLGIALTQQGKVPEALHHLMRGTPEQATQILSSLLYQTGKLADALAILDYASRWYVRADQWLTYGGIAYAAMDSPGTVRAYALAYRLEPEVFDASQLNAYAGALDEVGDHATCEAIAALLLRVAGDDPVWLTCGWAQLAAAYCGQGRFDEAVELAAKAVEHNPVPDNAAGFAATLARAASRIAKVAPQPAAARTRTRREPVFQWLADAELTRAAAAIEDPSWRVRGAALTALRHRAASDNAVGVPVRARAAAASVLADTVGLIDREACIARELALAIREQAQFARDPAPPLGDQLTREAFHREFRARGGVVLEDDGRTTPAFVDRIVVPDGRLARVSDYVALLRELAAVAPREALAEFDLDEAAYLEVTAAWTHAIEADPALAETIAAGLAKRT